MTESALKLNIFNKSILLILCVTATCLLEAQTWQFQDSVTLENAIQLINRDPQSNIYIHDTKGNVIKLDSSGNFLSVYAPSQYGQLTALECWPSLRVFLYYGNTQQYTFLDRYLSGGELTEFPASIGFARLATASSDNQIWVVDDRAFSLIKFDFTFSQITFESSFNQIPEIRGLKPYQLKEYQNRLYLGDELNGVLVFDNIGNFIRSFPLPAAVPLGFEQEELYYLHDNRIHFTGLYQSTHRMVPVPSQTPDQYTGVLVMGSKVALVSGNRIDFYRYKP